MFLRHTLREAHDEAILQGEVTQALEQRILELEMEVKRLQPFEQKSNEKSDKLRRRRHRGGLPTQLQGPAIVQTKKTS